jgi:hypothetical protein
MLVEIGGEEPDSVAVAGPDQPDAEHHHVCLRLDPDDLPDALKELRVHAKIAVTARCHDAAAIAGLESSEGLVARSRDDRQVHTLR